MKIKLVAAGSKRVFLPTVCCITFLLMATGCGSTSVLLNPDNLSNASHLKVVANAKAYALLLDPEGRFVNLIIAPKKYERLRNKDVARSDAEAITKWLYRHFRDAFDFVIFTFDDRQPRTEDPIGRHYRVKNEVDGIGLRLTDRTLYFGSAGRLGSVVLLRSHRNLRSGPSLHEILHRWGQNIIDTIYQRHWGLAGVGGQLGGWKKGTLEQINVGVYRGDGPTGGWFGIVANGGNRLPYAPWELYLMGLLPADSLETIEVAVGGEMRNVEKAIFEAKGIGELSIEEVIASFGPRRPAYPNAQRRFRALYVILSTRPLEEEQWEVISEDVRLFGLEGDDTDARLYNFWEATGGRAWLEMDDLGSALIERR